MRTGKNFKLGLEINTRPLVFTRGELKIPTACPAGQVTFFSSLGFIFTEKKYLNGIVYSNVLTITPKCYEKIVGNLRIT